MMVFIGHRILVLVAALAFCAGAAAADNAVTAAVRWLGSVQSSAGAIGGSQAGLAETAVAAAALRVAGARDATYYRALTYLENHAGGNVDFESRRVLALAPHGASLGGVRAFLADALRSGGSGTAGWGLSRDYAPSPLDTALALSAQHALAATEGVDEAIGFLALTRRAGGAADSGWALQLGGGSDRIVTALAVAALAPFEAGRAVVVPMLDAAATTLAALAGSAPDPLEIALAVKALAAAHRQAAPMQSLATTLRAMQLPDGSWTGDVLTTAIAVEALVASGGGDPAERFAPVGIPDAALRRAINRQLGRNAMDALNRDELAQLTELGARGLGIADLTGLEWAVNLRSADLRDNAIVSRAPLDGLGNLETVLLAGNPVFDTDGDGVSDGRDGFPLDPANSGPVLALPANARQVLVFDNTLNPPDREVWALRLVSLFTAQAISFGAAPSISYGGTGTVTATGGESGNAVTFSSQTTSVCTTSGTNGSTVTGVTVGTCTIAADQAGNANYNPAPQAALSFAVGPFCWECLPSRGGWRAILH